MEISKAQRRQLAREAQNLKPTVMLGREGLSAELTEKTRAELECHELVKVRFVSHKDQVAEISSELARESGAVLVRTLGHTAVLYRPHENPEKRRYLLT